MPLRWLFRRSIQSVVRAKASETIRRATKSALEGKAALPSPSPEFDDAPCRAAILFDMPIQLEAFIARLRGVVTNRAAGLDVHIGGYAGKRVALAVCGVPMDRPIRILETILAGHAPRLVIAAGSAFGLVEPLRAGDIIVPKELLTRTGQRLTIDFQAPPSPRVHLGPVVTVDSWLHEPALRHALAQQTGAMAADLVSFPIGAICQKRNVPFLSVRVISEAVDDAIGNDLLHLQAQKSLIGKAGAFAGALWRRPGNIKDLWKLKERSFEASDHLAAFLAFVLA
ncbi:MAG: hypothetical protein JW829_03910 [Pirellulales bacterium]|nr:hypothetical protein [Pirellulales bacterium]